MKSLSRLGLAVLVVTILVSRAASGQAPAARDLPLQPGARIRVRIWADSARGDSLIVQDDGSVMLPRLGKLELSGVSAPAVADSVRAAYATLLNPVSVEVTPLRRVSVVGEVKKPDVLFLETRATVREAIARAGGVGEIGRENPVILIRGNQKLPLDHWMVRNDDEATVRSGDVIVVERESWFKRNIFSVISGLGLVVSLIITASR
jgi:protein involved in polysaccharide export with SLBB domain